MTVYRKTLDFDGCAVHRDKHGDPPPGDPDGPWQWRSTQLAQGHRSQELWGWEYRSSAADGGPPSGDGWELNTYAGDQGYGQQRHGQVVAYWRRRKP